MRDAQHEVSEFMPLKAKFLVFGLTLTKPMTLKLKTNGHSNHLVASRITRFAAAIGSRVI